MTDDFSPLTQANHYLEWLGPDPAQAVRHEIESMLQKQVPTAVLEWLRLEGHPEFLTGGREQPGDPAKIILTRAALAVAFTLEVRSEEQTEQLKGVFSWVASGLDTARKDRAYLDIGIDIAWASDLLKERIYEIDHV